MKVVALITLSGALVFSSRFAAASTIVFNDLTDTTFVTIDGTKITGNGGNVSNFSTSGESISFTFTSSVPAAAGQGGTFFTRLLDPAGSDDTRGTLSDVFVVTLTVGSKKIGVKFGTDPNLPSTAGGTTLNGKQNIPLQYFENGTPQRVATYFNLANGKPVDKYFIQSDVPEPASALLFCVGLVVLFGAKRFFTGPTNSRFH
jgi:hypothetical protein